MTIQRFICNFIEENCYIVSDDHGQAAIIDCGAYFPEEKQAISALEKTIADIYDLTREKLSAKYDSLVSFVLYKTPSFKKAYIDSVMADSMGYAGTEIIRRVVGDSKVMEVTSVKDAEKRIPMERALIKIGKAFIMQRETISSGKEIVDMFRAVIAE